VAKVWTFVIRGEAEVTVTAKHQPTLYHPGRGTTIWKMVGDEAEADRIKKVLADEGLHVERYTEFQSKEQEAERMRRLGREPTED
jgi:cobalamin biosynthesis protein CbiG